MNQDYQNKYKYMKRINLIILIVLTVVSVNAQVNDSIIKVIEDKVIENTNARYSVNVGNINNNKNDIKRIDTALSQIKNTLDNIAFTLKDNINVTQESQQKINKLLIKNNIFNDSISSLNLKINNHNEIIDKLNKELNAVISILESEGVEIKELKQSIDKKQLYWIIIIIVILFLIILGYLIQEKRRAIIREELLKKQKEIFEKQIEEGLKLAKWFEKQSENELIQVTNSSSEIDHSFAKRVADEIVKNNATLSRMDESIKGHKHLTRSMQKLEQTLNSNSYELINMLNKPYNEGMNVIATFIPDETLEDGKQVITRIIKPQINYKGKMIQAAEVQVSQG